MRFARILGGLVMSFNEDWEEVKLGDIAKFKNGKSIDEDKRNDEYNVKIYGSNGIIGKTDQPLIEDEVIIIGRVGAYCGSVQFSNQPAWITDNAIACDIQKGNTKFVYYYLKTIPIRKMAGGSAQPLINQSILKNLKINIPSLEEQNYISNILSTFDKKIRNNNKMNQTLEEMAQTIYKSWFVDFEPFQNKKFVESELGLIPEGWEVVSLHSLANYVNGGSFPQRILSKEIKGLPVIKISELNSNGVTNNTKYYNKDDYRKKYELQTGDVLFAWSASLGIYLWSNGKALLNQHIYNVKPTDRVSKEILYFILQEVIDEFIRIAASRATTMGHITKTHLKQKKIVIPPENVLDDLDKIIKPIFNKILNNKIENQTLVELRDALLPKLMSGKIKS